jgi:hypothetical protein
MRRHRYIGRSSFMVVSGLDFRLFEYRLLEYRLLEYRL